MKLVRSKAPLRISFGGGGTDVSPYCDSYEGICFNSTIDKYSYCTIVPNNTNKVNVESLDFDLRINYNVGEYLYGQGLDLVTVCLKEFNINEGADVILHTDVPAGCGLGTSSAVLVAIIKALDTWKCTLMSNYQIAEMAYHLEREVLGISGGYQDQYCAAFGGFNFMKFKGGTNVEVNKLHIPINTINELNYNLVLCYTGNVHISAHIIEDQVSNYHKQDVLESLNYIKELSQLMKTNIIKNRLDEFGLLLNEAWKHKKVMSDKISNPQIDNLYDIALDAGALGGKLLGAGGGGYLLFYCPFDKRPQIANILKTYGGTVTDFRFDLNGVQSWII